MKKFLPKTLNNPQGFTLIELLVVISIIAILSVIGITVYSSVQSRARDAKRKEDVQAISKALETHYNSTANQYCTAAAGTYCALVDTWFASGTRPKDPTGTDYGGLPSDGATIYSVCATLDDTKTKYCQDSQQ